MSRNPSGRPSRLEIKAAGNAVDIKQLPSKIETGSDAAFHGLEIDLTQSHATARDELIFVQRFPIDLQFGRAQLPNHLVRGRARERSPYHF